MKKNQYWTVKRTHMKTALNDEDTWAIVDYQEKVIVSFYNGDYEKLISVCDAHNLCCMEQEDTGDAD